MSLLAVNQSHNVPFSTSLIPYISRKDNHTNDKAEDIANCIGQENQFDSRMTAFALLPDQLCVNNMASNYDIDYNQSID